MRRNLIIIILLVASQAINAQVNEPDSLIFETTEDVESIGHDEDIFIIVEEMPKFQGKDLVAFQEYVQENIKYPKEFAEEDLFGRVYVQFVVNRQGNVTNVEVIKRAGQYFDEEAVRVIKSSPKWEPGKQRGKAVNVRFVVPVVFRT